VPLYCACFLATVVFRPEDVSSHSTQCLCSLVHAFLIQKAGMFQGARQVSVGPCGTSHLCTLTCVAARQGLSISCLPYCMPFTRSTQPQHCLYLHMLGPALSCPEQLLRLRCQVLAGHTPSLAMSSCHPVHLLCLPTNLKCTHCRALCCCRTGLQTIVSQAVLSDRISRSDLRGRIACLWCIDAFAIAC
jgi:hypothetical protein